MADKENSSNAKASEKKDDAFKPEGRPTAREVAEKAAKDNEAEDAQLLGEEE